MTKRMGTKPKARKTKTLLQVFEVPDHVSWTEFITGLGTKKIRFVGHELINNFPQLLGKGNKPVFITLTTDGKNQIIQIYIRRTKGKALVDSQSSVYQRKDYRLEPPICPGCGNPLYNSAHLLNCRGY